MALARLYAVRRLHRGFQEPQLPLANSTFFRSLQKTDVIYSQSSRSIFTPQSYLHFPSSGGVFQRSIVNCSYTISSIINLHADKDACGSTSLGSTRVPKLTVSFNEARSMSTMKAAAPSGARKVALRVTMLSPGFVYDPYKPREPIPFWRRWFTRSGWRRTKEDLITEMKSAYAISRLRKKVGYSKKTFYQHALRLYKEINTLLANGDTSSLRKVVTEKMYSTLKNELKRRESMWSSVYWELVEPVVGIRTLRARMIALDKNDLNKAFIQLTLEITSKQKFEACDAKGNVVSGDKTKEVLVRDVWVVERSLFHQDAAWRLCARLSV
ncbi:39S ribosomal protein L45, mitochondrial isoform X1 [Canna indica]|uniref:Large ribosomal subunit protein mL45 n=1 Tax=Canna indica TaxID=4628 RepID=A0AAQ3Q440_9LILI|nr:39S ribosomal protein L45, mitochondrial isoform X1 [Canna indica]